MIRKRDLIKNINDLSNEINSLKVQLYDIQYPNGNVYTSRDPSFGGLNYLNYSYTHNNKLVDVYITECGYGLRGYKFEKYNDRTFIAVKIALNDSIEEKYYVVDLYKEVSIETTNIDNLKNLEWIEIH
jgi:hypothetical protein